MVNCHMSLIYHCLSSVTETWSSNKGRKLQSTCIEMLVEIVSLNLVGNNEAET